MRPKGVQNLNFYTFPKISKDAWKMQKGSQKVAFQSSFSMYKRCFSCSANSLKEGSDSSTAKHSVINYERITRVSEAVAR